MGFQRIDSIPDYDAHVRSMMPLVLVKPNRAIVLATIQYGACGIFSDNSRFYNCDFFSKIIKALIFFVFAAKSGIIVIIYNLATSLQPSLGIIFNYTCMIAELINWKVICGVA